jgi:glucan-binding YG repeat protein
VKKLLLAGLLSCSLIFSGVGNNSADAASVTNIAKEQLGKPYVWGGTSPNGFDCSGFVYYTFKQMGVRLPRTAADMYNKGQAVSKSNLQSGDLVFFSTYKPGASHVGIFIGDNQFIHAGTTDVRIDSLSNTYWANAYLGSKRISGVNESGWVKSGANWSYYENGSKATGWVKWNGEWYLLDGNGVMETGWELDKGEWYYLKEVSGAMKTGWKYLNHKWYYMLGNGKMKTGWILYKNQWYYLQSDGSMAVNTTIDGYIINSDGVWIE